MQRVNEGAPFELTVSYTKADGSAFTPDAARYTVCDRNTGTKVLGPVSYIPASATETLSLPGGASAILDQTNKTEQREVSIEADDSGALVGIGTIDFFAVNVCGLP